jgi:hypothetical protein
MSKTPCPIPPQSAQLLLIQKIKKILKRSHQHDKPTRIHAISQLPGLLKDR